MLPRKSKRIVDIGGGRGAIVVNVKKALRADFAGVIDISEDAVLNKFDSVDAAIVGNAENAGFVETFCQDHGPIDLFLCQDVLEHLVDPWKMIYRIHDQLPVGGHILASIPNIQNYRGVIRTITGTWKYKDTGLFDRTHLRFFGKSGALNLMSCTGLKIMDVRRTYSHLKMDKIIDKATFGLMSRFVTLQYVVLVRKTADSRIDPGQFGSNT